MILGESLLFFVALIDTAAILFVLVYYIITLSDLECDYLNAQECCDKLNNWLFPKYIAQVFLTILLLSHGRVSLFLINLPMFIWQTFEFFTVPRGNLGAYDPAEIHNRGQLKKHLKHVLLHVVFYLVCFFLYLYSIIIALLKGDPLTSGVGEDGIVEVETVGPPVGGFHYKI